MNETLKLARQSAYKRGYNVAKRKAYEWLKTIDPDYHVGSDKAGSIRTGLRTTSNVDRTKKKKPYDWTV